MVFFMTIAVPASISDSMPPLVVYEKNQAARAKLSNPKIKLYGFNEALTVAVNKGRLQYVRYLFDENPRRVIPPSELDKLRVCALKHIRAKALRIAVTKTYDMDSLESVQAKIEKYQDILTFINDRTLSISERMDSKEEEFYPITYCFTRSDEDYLRENLSSHELETLPLIHKERIQKLLKIIEDDTTGKYTINHLKTLSDRTRLFDKEEVLEIVSIFENCLKKMIAGGIDINSSKSGTPPLIASIGSIFLFLALLNVGADVNVRDSLKNTPLHRASLQGKIDYFQILLESNPDVNARNLELCTPLHLSAMGGFNDIMQLLLKDGAEVDARDKHDFTPLHYGVAFSPVIALLQKHNANPNAKVFASYKNRTPLQMAAKKRSYLSMRCLFDFNIKVSVNFLTNIRVEIVLKDIFKTAHKAIVSTKKDFGKAADKIAKSLEVLNLLNFRAIMINEDP